VNIVSDKKGYVIIDADEWRNIYETIYLNNIKGLSKSIIKSSKEPLDSSTPLNKVDW
ncbi:MAG: type II toxin-antitoxin system prevent-host-death family antitoxin, partial [Bacteroidetes bacterium]|nr:type II toxin-antitoxin system prevent-host-death family antitoxin [Bacteroidota bacterium]